MNFIFLSPHFPPNYERFGLQLRELGANVLGLGDQHYHWLSPRLQAGLTEYYRVNDMHYYDELLRACGYFTHKYGKIDRLDSHNEYWLETEARLRTDFNITGPKNEDMPKFKRKSVMKKVFSKAGIRTAHGRVVKNLNEAKRLIDETGYPVVAKPDIGVGAAQTYKINDFGELERFFAQKAPVDYIIEEYIQGQISTFDGLADQDGKLVFFASLQYSQGIMETVNDDSLIYYYTQRVIPADLEEVGRRTAKAFNVTERFFHFEFFRSSLDDELVALEVNMRPPGGLTTDMWNFSEDLDIYREWANVLVFNTFSAKIGRKYHCCYIGRKFNRPYAHSHEQIMDCFGSQVVHHELINGVFSAALGDYGYLVRSPDLGEIHMIAEYIQRAG